MILKLVFIAVILYIIIIHCMEDEQPTQTPKAVKLGLTEVRPMQIMPTILNPNEVFQTQKPREQFQEQIPIAKVEKNIPLYDMPQQKEWDFDNPNPWSKVVYNPQDEFPYKFHIKLRIPSLKDYQDWQQIIPNIDFSPISKEVIIPSKDEASALAVANLMSINFGGQMSLENILNKNLIQISIAKATAHEVVRNKLKEQIMENIKGKPMFVSKPNFESDLARNNVQEKPSTQQPSSRVDFQSNQFQDTFQHFSNTNDNSNNGPDAFDGGDYSSF
jgi:hypothetical protein